VLTVECQIPFGTRYQLPPSPFMTGGSVFAAGPPTTTVSVLFNEVMDDAVLPSAGSFLVTIDGNPVVPFNFSWPLAQILRFDVTCAGPAVSGNITLLSQDVNLRNLVGTMADIPQSAVFFP